MRISRTGWLATKVLFLANQVAASQNNTVVVFSNEPFTQGFDPNYAVLNAATINGFSWHWTARNVTVLKVSLMKESWNANGKQIERVIEGIIFENGKRSVVVGSAFESSPVSNAIRASEKALPEHPRIQTQLNVYPGWFGGTATLQVYNESELVGLWLYFEVVWKKNDFGIRGQSYSRLFTIAHSLNDVDNKDEFKNILPHVDELQESESTSTTSGIPPSETGSPNGSGAPGTSISDKDNPSTTSCSTSAEDTCQPSKAKGRGLSGGAIIGISVACGVIGLLLVFALVWYLRRKYLQKQGSVGSPGTEAKGSLMAEKDGGVDSEAHSPYSDVAAPGAAPAPALPRHPSLPSDTPVQPSPQHSYSSPYSNHSVPGAVPAAIPVPVPGTPSVGAASSVIAGPAADETRVSVPSTATTAPSTPVPAPVTTAPAGRALSTPLTHLIEEGMTEEDIRRLEEEERELDQAIDERLGPRARRVE